MQWCWNDNISVHFFYLLGRHQSEPICFFLNHDSGDPFIMLVNGSLLDRPSQLLRSNAAQKQVLMYMEVEVEVEVKVDNLAPRRPLVQYGFCNT